MLHVSVRNNESNQTTINQHKRQWPIDQFDFFSMFVFFFYSVLYASKHIVYLFILKIFSVQIVIPYPQKHTVIQLYMKTLKCSILLLHNGECDQHLSQFSY